MTRASWWCIPCLLAAGACDGPGAPPTAEPIRPNVLLVTLDTTRADVLSSGGGDGSVAPNLEALAARSIVCTAARTTAPMTLPAHTSMFTGLYPFAHGVRDNDAFRLEDGAPTLARELGARGYRCEAFVAATVLHDGTGLDQGFERYHDLDFRRARNLAKEAERTADAVTDEVLPRLVDPDPRPWFFWVHYFDPHHPYAPPGMDPSTPRRQRYDGEVAFVDQQFGRLLEALDAAGVRDRTAVIVVGDHGEGLLLEEELTHGFLLEHGTLRVPLMVHLPGETSATYIDAPTSVVDVYPSVLAIAGATPPGPIHGRDLLKLREDPKPDRSVYFEALHGYHALRWAPLSGLATARLRYVEGSRAEVTDLVDQSRRDDMAPAFRTRLDELLARPTESFESTTVEASAAEQARLRSLGYLTVTSSREIPDAADLPDPRDAYRQYLLYEQGLSLALEGRNDEALILVEPMVEAYPDNPVFRDRLGRLYLAAGRPADGIDQLERALALDPDLISAHYYLGRALQLQGDLEGAARHLAAAVDRFAGHYEALLALRDVQSRLGRLDELLVTCVQLIAACDEVGDAAANETREATLEQLPQVVALVRQGEHPDRTLTACRELLRAMKPSSRQRLTDLLAD